MWLVNENITLRALEPEDLDLLYSWENQSEHWDSTSTIQPYSRFALREYISQAAANIYESKQLRLMIKDNQTQQTVGTVDLYNLDIHHSRVAVGLFVASEFQGNGYAKSALQLVEDYVFNYLNINQLYAEVSVENKVSIQLFSRAGFKVSYLQQWIKTAQGFEDVGFFQKFGEKKLKNKD